MTMEVYQTSITNFQAGQGTANATPQRIVEPGYANRAYKGVHIRCLTGTMYVGHATVSAESGYELPAGKDVLLQIEDPASVYVVAPGGATYAWLCC